MWASRDQVQSIAVTKERRVTCEALAAGTSALQVVPNASQHALLFIGGAHHSGTSLLNRMLCEQRPRTFSCMDDTGQATQSWKLPS